MELIYFCVDMHWLYIQMYIKLVYRAIAATDPEISDKLFIIALSTLQQTVIKLVTFCVEMHWIHIQMQIKLPYDRGNAKKNTL